MKKIMAMMVVLICGQVFASEVTDTDLFKLYNNGNEIWAKEIIVTNIAISGTVDAGGTLYVTNNRVGVGVSNPLSKLTVGGASPAINLYNSSGSIDYKYYYLANNADRLTWSWGNDAWTGWGSIMSMTHNGVSIGSTYSAQGGPTDGLIVQGNVGIGTNTPQSKLHVNGTILASDATAGVTAPGVQIRYVPSTEQGQIYSISNNATYKSLTIDGSSVLLQSQSGGSVGIGTNSPQAALHVNGGILSTNLTISGATTLNGLTLATGGVSAPNAGSRFVNCYFGSWGNSALGNSLGSYLNFGNNLTESYTLQTVAGVSNANVFVLNAIPAATTNNLFALQKNGTNQVVVDNAGKVGVGGGANVVGAKLTVTGTPSTDQTGASIWLEDISPGVPDSRKWAIGTGSAEYGSLSFNVGASYLASPIGGGNIEALRLKKDGTAYLYGSVGIGTNTPQAKLHVVGAGTATSIANVQDGILTVNDAANNGNTSLQFVRGGVKHGSWAAPSSILTLTANNSKNFRITSASDDGVGTVGLWMQNGTADIGIGTNTPQAKLHVVGDALASGSLTASNVVGTSGATITDGAAGVYIYRSGVPQYLRIKNDSAGSTFEHYNTAAYGAKSLIFQNSTTNVGSDIRFLINSDYMSYIQGGWLGIGTYNPTCRLDVDGGNARIGGQLVTTGSVGVGTNTPQAKLHVVGGIIASNISLNTTSAAYPLEVYGGSRFGGGIMRVNDSMFWDSAAEYSMGQWNGSANTDILRFDARKPAIWFPVCSVGIGTNTPQAKLHVVGGIIASNLTLGASAGTPHSSAKVLISDATAGASESIQYMGATDGNQYLFWGDTDSATAAYFYYNHGADTWKEVIQGTEVQVKTATATTMYPLSAGNVGIGTNTPQAKLDIAGSVRIGSTITAGNLICTNGVAYLILPTSATGLPAGTLWNNGGTVSVAP